MILDWSQPGTPPSRKITDADGVVHREQYFTRLDTVTGRAERLVRREGRFVVDAVTRRLMRETLTLPAPVTVEDVHGNVYGGGYTPSCVEATLTFAFGPPELLVTVEQEDDVCVARLKLAKAEALHAALGRLIAVMKGKP